MSPVSSTTSPRQLMSWYCPSTPDTCYYSLIHRTPPDKVYHGTWHGSLPMLAARIGLNMWGHILVLWVRSERVELRGYMALNQATPFRSQPWRQATIPPASLELSPCQHHPPLPN